MKSVIYFGSVAVPTYLLAISLIYSSMLFWVVRRAASFYLQKRITLDLSLAVMVGGFLGARLLHVVYEEPKYYLENPLNVFRFWQGGFVFYGGFFGAFLASEWVVSRYHLTRTTWQDLFTPLFPAGYALGRLACFLAGCCYGRPANLPWAVSFPAGVEAPAFIPRHPTQLYALVWEVALLAAVLLIEKNKTKTFLNRPGQLFYFWIFGHAIGRLIMESLRADARGPFIMGLSISSWISLGLIPYAGWKLACETRSICIPKS